MYSFSVDDVVLLHERSIFDYELQGIAGDKSLELVLARVENRMHFGMINDVYDLAACYAVCLATGHVFNDANKRTAYSALKICLDIHGVKMTFNTQEIGDKIRQVAQGMVDEIELAKWLRQQSLK